jgi:hypothetical protein
VVEGLVEGVEEGEVVVLLEFVEGVAELVELLAGGVLEDGERRLVERGVLGGQLAEEGVEDVDGQGEVVGRQLSEVREHCLLTLFRLHTEVVQELL